MYRVTTNLLINFKKKLGPRISISTNLKFVCVLRFGISISIENRIPLLALFLIRSPTNVRALIEKIESD